MEFQIYSEEEKETLLSVVRDMKPPFKAKVDNIYKGRSIPQNRYYHLIKKKAADHLGELPHELHRKFLKMFALIEEKYDEKKHKGKGMLYLIDEDDMGYVVESTAGMDTLRMEKFLEDIKRWMLTIHGLYLPEPNEMIDDTDELILKLI